MTIGYPGSVHNHTDYSNIKFRDSINRIETIVDYAIELGHEVIAITEHDALSNAVKAEKYYKKVKKNNPNFKLILGNEIYLCRDGLDGQNFIKGEDKYFHFILLAKDLEGHQQIRELSTRAWKRSYIAGKQRRVPTYYQDLIEIIGTNPGHVIGSTACLGGFLATKILQWSENPDNEFYSKIISWIENMKNLFGFDNFYLELQPSAQKEQIIVNKELIKLANLTNTPYIITTDSHYLKKEDANIHKAFLQAQETEREVDSFYSTTYLMGTNELESYLDYLTKDELNRAYNSILKIKNSCEDYTLAKPLKIPSMKWRPLKIDKVPNKYVEAMPYMDTFIKSKYPEDNYLALMVAQKFEDCPELCSKKMFDEVNDNLRITWVSSEVNNARWSAYFLNLQHILDVCWEAGTLIGPGRGSGVGFVLLYILDIIQINAVEETTKLYSWRFLNPDRVSVLDIDTDIEGSRRATVLKALKDYYGEDYVANVGTFRTEKSKQAIQTAARGLGIDVDVALYISSLIPVDRGAARTLSQCYYGDKENDFAPVPLFVQQMNEYPDLWEVAKHIEGLVCGSGEHAGGIIFTDEPLTNSTALMRVANDDLVTQYDLHDAEDCSLIKIDLLSVECLDKIHTCLELLVEYNYIEKKPTLKETYETYLGIYNLERNNPEMWNMVWNHEILSLFQMEQQSGVQGIALTKPKSIDDLAVLNSVIRLMAQEKGGEQPLNKYARFKKDINLWYDEMRKYGLTAEEQDILKPIVESSYGICESQEKFMSLVQLPECGGFSLGWADALRKAIAKKNPAAYDQLTVEYFDNMRKKGLSENLCNYVWNVLVATSRGYGFRI